MKKPLDVASLVSAAKPRRSPLYVWMLENHDALRDVLTKDMRPNWTAMAAKFAEADLNDADGKAPTSECARQTWWRVRKSVAAKGAGGPAQRPAPRRQPGAGTPSPAPTPTAPRPQTAQDIRALLSPGLPTPKPIFE